MAEGSIDPGSGQWYDATPGTEASNQGYTYFYDPAYWARSGNDLIYGSPYESTSDPWSQNFSFEDWMTRMASSPQDESKTTWPMRQGKLSDYFGIGGPVPTYFTNQPANTGLLSPMALRWLAEIFQPSIAEYPEPTGQWSQQPLTAGQPLDWNVPWELKEYQTKEGKPAVTIPQSELQASYADYRGRPWSPPDTVLQEEVKPETWLTAAITPQAPSAQAYRKLEAEGALPMLQSYFKNILGQPEGFEQFYQKARSSWAPQKTGSPSWRVPTQR